MKRNYFTLLIASLLVMFSCEKKQSEMSMDMLKEKATIEGYIMYNAGVDTTSADNYLIDSRMPAVNKKLFVEVPYALFKAGSEGNYIIETTTDETGHYSVEVPTTSAPKTGGFAPATVRMEPFTAFVSKYDKMLDGKPSFKTDMFKFTYDYDLGGALLSPGEVFIIDENNVECTATKVSLDSLNLNEKITLKGNIKLAYEKGFRDGAYKTAQNARVEFKVKYATNPEPSTAPAFYIFNTTTDAQGNYSITLPVESYEIGFEQLAVEVKGLTADYKHFTAAGKSVTVDGAYESQNISNLTSGMKNIVDGMEYKMPEMKVKFTPGFNNGISTGPVPATWENNLIGWETYSDFPTTQTVKGTYLLAKETSFGVGDYANDHQVAYVSMTYPGTDMRGGGYGYPVTKTYAIATDAEGKFSFEAPVIDEREDLSIKMVAPTTNSGIDYLSHFLPNGTEINLLGGSYGLATSKAIKEITDHPLFDLGTAYFNFTPSAADVADADKMWESGLAAWQMPSAIEGKRMITKNLTCKVFIPTETSVAVGKYVAADKMTATVTVGSDIYTFPIVGGSFSGDIYLADATAEPTISIAIDQKVKDFAHFDIAGKKTYIEGKYIQNTSHDGYWTGKEAEDRTAWNNLGDLYCSFTPTTTPKNWDLFKEIAGWVRPESTETIKRTITGKLFNTAETGYYVGSYVQTANMPTLVKVGGKSYTTLTNAQGLINLDVYVSEADDVNKPAVTIEPLFIDPLGSGVKFDYNTYVNNIKEVAKVTYSKEFEAGRIAGYTAWYDRGSIYYKVASSNIPVASNLLNWENTKNLVQNKFTDVINVVGAVLKASIKADGTAGEWVANSAAKPMEISFDGGSTFFKTVFAGSQFSIPYNVATVPASIPVIVKVLGGNANNVMQFTYRYIDPVNPPAVLTEIIYGYDETGMISATASREAQTNNFYITPMATISDNNVLSNKVMIRFMVTEPINPSSLTNWSTFSPTYLVDAI